MPYSAYNQELSFATNNIEINKIDFERKEFNDSAIITGFLINNPKQKVQITFPNTTKPKFCDIEINKDSPNKILFEMEFSSNDNEEILLYELPPIEMTQKEIEDKLGYKIKVVDEREIKGDKWQK